MRGSPQPGEAGTTFQKQVTQPATHPARRSHVTVSAEEALDGAQRLVVAEGSAGW